MPQRKPGHAQGVRRFQRYGQTTLDVGKTLRFSLRKERLSPCERCGEPWEAVDYPRHDDLNDHSPGGVCFTCEPEGW